ncbi:hypothetical protein D9M71_839280 [compost metagenome]
MATGSHAVLVTDFSVVSQLNQRIGERVGLFAFAMLGVGHLNAVIVMDDQHLGLAQDLDALRFVCELQRGTLRIQDHLWNC